MKNLALKLTIFTLIFATMALAMPAAASTPRLSISSNGDNLTLNVSNAEPNETVEVNYINPGTNSAAVINNYNWNTDNNGYFSTSFNARSYGIMNGAVIYVTVDRQRSDSYQHNPGNYYNYYDYNYNGGYYYGNYFGPLSFSGNNPTISLGQTQYVSVYNAAGYAGTYYVSGNSNPSAVVATMSGTEVSLFGQNTGTAKITVCQNVAAAVCGSFSVSVVNNYFNYYNYSGNENLTFSQNIISLAPGQSAVVSASGNQPVSVMTNNNPQVASVTANGNVLTVYAASNGYTAARVCQNGNYNYSCGTIYISVTGSAAPITPPLPPLIYGQTYYGNGQLVNIGGAVYIAYKNTLTGFGNASAFLGLGYSFRNVTNAAAANMPISSYIVASASGAHPWGSWIKNGQAVYFVHETGLIPIPDWNTFLNNNGPANQIVNANAWDFQKPILSPMTASDYRLR